MMKIKDTINFKTLREKGPSSIELTDDEVVQLVSRNSDIKVIVTQEYFLTLLSAYNNILQKNADRKENRVSIEDRLSSFEEKMDSIYGLIREDNE